MQNYNEQQNESNLTDRLIQIIREMTEDEQRNLLTVLEDGLFEWRRENFRKPFLMTVDYSAQGVIYKDFIQNISASGVFIETRMPFTVGQEVSLTFPLPKYQKHIKISGEIVRTTGDGIGVKFTVPTQEQEKTIKTLLEMI